MTWENFTLDFVFGRDLPSTWETIDYLTALNFSQNVALFTFVFYLRTFVTHYTFSNGIPKKHTLCNHSKNTSIHPYIHKERKSLSYETLMKTIDNVVDYRIG
jgi:hypothetical protein